MTVKFSQQGDYEMDTGHREVTVVIVIVTVKFSPTKGDYEMAT